MDLQKTIQELQFQKQRLEHTIAELEQLQNGDGGGRVAVQAKRRTQALQELPRIVRRYHIML